MERGSGRSGRVGRTLEGVESAAAAQEREREREREKRERGGLHPDHMYVPYHRVGLYVCIYSCVCVCVVHFVCVFM